jgi:outer membrane protein TolC
MKILRLLVPILILPLVTYSQNVDYNKIILPERIPSLTFDEKLVQLAWKNHPSNKIVMENVEIAHKEKIRAGWSWLDNIYAVGNLNEFTIDPSSSERSTFYPRYNFGVRLSLGMFVQTPIESGIARNRLLSAEHSVNEKKLQLRSDVLISLERFKENYKLKRLRQNLKEEYYQMFKQMEKKFQANEIRLEQLQTSQESYFRQTENFIQIQSKYNQEKLNLESFLGLKLEDVTGYQEYLNTIDAELKQEN